MKTVIRPVRGLLLGGVLFARLGDLSRPVNNHPAPCLSPAPLTRHAVKTMGGRGAILLTPDLRMSLKTHALTAHSKTQMTMGIPPLSCAILELCLYFYLRGLPDLQGDNLSDSQKNEIMGYFTGLQTLYGKLSSDVSPRREKKRNPSPRAPTVSNMEEFVFKAMDRVSAIILPNMDQEGFSSFFINFFTLLGKVVQQGDGKTRVVDFLIVDARSMDATSLVAWLVALKDSLSTASSSPDSRVNSSNPVSSAAGTRVGGSSGGFLSGPAGATRLGDSLNGATNVGNGAASNGAAPKGVVPNSSGPGGRSEELRLAEMILQQLPPKFSRSEVMGIYSMDSEPHYFIVLKMSDRYEVVQIYGGTISVFDILAEVPESETLMWSWENDKGVLCSIESFSLSALYFYEGEEEFSLSSFPVLDRSGSVPLPNPRAGDSSA